MPCPAQTQQHFFCSAPSPQDRTRHGTYWCLADFVEAVLSFGFGSWGLDNMIYGRRKYFLHGLLSLICSFQFWKLQIMPMSLLMFVWRMFPIIAHPRDPDLGMVLRKARCPRSMSLSCLLHVCSPCCRLFPRVCGPSLGLSLFVIKKTQQPNKKSRHWLYLAPITQPFPPYLKKLKQWPTKIGRLNFKWNQKQPNIELNTYCFDSKPFPWTKPWGLSSNGKDVSGHKGPQKAWCLA